MQYNIPMGMGLGLSGFANFGHDVGGFAGDPPDAELFLRWVQSGLLLPRFTINSWYRACEEAPWMHESVLAEVRAALKLRYALIPYLYALLLAAEQTGAPVIRPTVYHFPDDPKTRDQSFEYMVGEWLLAARSTDRASGSGRSTCRAARLGTIGTAARATKAARRSG